MAKEPPALTECLFPTEIRYQCHHHESHTLSLACRAFTHLSVLFLVQACRGLGINEPEAQICFTRPRLPASMGELRIHNREVAGGDRRSAVDPPRAGCECLRAAPRRGRPDPGGDMTHCET